jgi:hypothetical protein
VETDIRDNIMQLWQNQQEMREGLAAAEINLRAFQKVLIAIKPDIDWQQAFKEVEEEFLKNAEPPEEKLVTEPSQDPPEVPEGATVFGG